MKKKEQKKGGERERERENKEKTEKKDSDWHQFECIKEMIS